MYTITVIYQYYRIFLNIQEFFKPVQTTKIHKSYQIRTYQDSVLKLELPNYRYRTKTMGTQKPEYHRVQYY